MRLVSDHERILLGAEAAIPATTGFLHWFSRYDGMVRDTKCGQLCYCRYKLVSYLLQMTIAIADTSALQTNITGARSDALDS